MNAGDEEMIANDDTTEAGSTLLLILVFLTSIGLLGAALMNYEITLNKQSFSTRRVQTRETGVNTGLEWAVNSLKQGKDGFCQGGYDRDVVTVGGREVEVRCQADDADRNAASNVAVFLNRAEPAELNRLRTSGALGPGGTTQIAGPVYLGVKGGWSIETPLRVDGDVLVGTEDGRCEPNETLDLPENMTALYANARNCSTDLSTVTPQPVPQPCEVYEKCPDPAPRLLDVKGNDTKSAPACKVFVPGYYRNAPALAGNNYFVPGTYYFELDEEWRIASAVRGGDPAPETGVAEAAQSATSIPRCAGAPEPSEPWGVTFVFGGRSTMRIMDTARVELFSFVTKETELPNIVSGGQKLTTEWARRSEFTLERNLLSVGGGSPEFLLHSGIYAPDSAVSMTGTSRAVEKIGGTVVVGRLELNGDSSDTSKTGKDGVGSEVSVAVETPSSLDEAAPGKDGSDASAAKPGNIGIFARAGTAKKFVLIARSCPGGRDVITRNACSAPPPGPLEPELCAVASATVYDDGRRTLYVDNWRVDRDPSRFDPATCVFS